MLHDPLQVHQLEATPSQLCLRLPMVVRHTITSESALASWRSGPSGIGADASSEIVVVVRVTSHLNCCRATMQRCLWYFIVRNLLSSEISDRSSVFERSTRPAPCFAGLRCARDASAADGRGSEACGRVRNLPRTGLNVQVDAIKYDRSKGG